MKHQFLGHLLPTRVSSWWKHLRQMFIPLTDTLFSPFKDKEDTAKFRFGSELRRSLFARGGKQRAKQIFWRGMLFERTQGLDFVLTSQNSPSGQIKPTQDGRPRADDPCFCCWCCSTTTNIKVIWDRQTATHPSPVIWQEIEPKV